MPTICNSKENSVSSMKSAASSCRCGNIQISGQILPPGATPNIPPSERRFFLACRHIFCIRSNNVEIRDLSRIQARMLSPTCADLCCSCSTMFRFYCGASVSYFGKLSNLTSNTKSTLNLTSTGINGSNPSSTLNCAQNRNPNKLSFHGSSVTTMPTLSIPHILVPLINRPTQSSPPIASSNDNILDDDEEIEIDPDLEFNFNSNSGRNSRDIAREVALVSNDDTDFELMFSSKVDPVVGSFMGIPADGTLGNVAFADFMPKSYYS
ncbi:hypothetical protein TRFO_26312 [Tritrichomonas foetus]|uniref:Uncharacterized protein n=1 Tax=Tritrichomonas foetus TaxID=1144522 RepID=A0A1J4K7Y4_9EUKA|nr:hypothetical protein TRFO_26312 [Tritrichomonas foetus]|eukprot:OHT05812.1 hypothetical protein TRFO_26312 [Tritrichomonas foetus]